ncbi:hypothetical protein A9Q80_02995 [Cycloclasticus sp. 46_83_sub15_T18]|nr:hypothetical protein A9Q80_02995 [Cycloclasticus sp. 46_83_sub15_T18]
MNEQQQICETDELSAQQIRHYLLNNPDFFNHYPELVDEIKITDQRAGVVSLTMRQLAQLRDKNQQAQKQLDGLLVIARENDASFGRMQQLTTRLMEARCVEDVFASLDDSLRECFAADFFAIRLLDSAAVADFPISEVVWQQDALQLESFAGFLEGQQIKCGQPTHKQAEALFNEQAAQVQSAALIPLRIEQLDGVLAIGSKDEQRFHSAMGNLFLAHLGELVAKRLASLLPLKDV